MIKLKLFLTAVMVCFLWGDSSIQAQEAPVRILALSATSSQDPLFDLASLLDHSAKVGWKPGISGTGAEEGIFIQFEKPVVMNAVVLDGTGDFVVSMNGIEINDDDGYFYVPGEIDISTLFIHVASHPSGPVELEGIKLCLGGQAIPVEKPLTVNGEVTAANVLSPEPVFGAFRLFDSRPDLAFSLDGKKIDPKNPIPLFDLTLGKSEKLKGFYIWNGCQLSDDLYVANARPKTIKVSSGDLSAQFDMVDDKTGPQWFAFPGKGWDVSKLNFEAESIFPGRDYKDLLISEICFVTSKGRVLMVRIPQEPQKKLPGDLEKVFEKSLVSFSGMGGKTYSLKFRQDGTFAAIREMDRAEGGTVRKIWEGNWSPEGPNQILIFGKTYVSDPAQTTDAYGAAVSTPEEKTFHTTLTITDLSHPTSADADHVYNFMMAANPGGKAMLDHAAFWKLIQAQPGPVFVESNLFSQIMVRDEFKK